MHSEFNEEDVKQILLVLKHLSETNRFKLSVEFLSGSEKQKCGELFNRIKSLSRSGEDGCRCEVDQSVLEETCNNYGIQMAEKSAAS